MSDHKYAYPLILNKVASPRYATPTLRRARLLDWLNESATRRATVINADAGYGKTTLLWQWEREVEFPCYWYKLDRNDRDWTLHISYLAESIAKRHPGFGRRTHSMLEQMGGPGSSRPGVTAYLLAEMHKRLTEPCTFIIDDWQYVNAVTEVRGLWNQILRDAPSTCRFVFASRVRPTLQFARFKTHGGYAELKTDALRFTPPEIDELFRDVYNDPLEPGEISELEKRTEGWAASLQLIEVSLRDLPTPRERQGFIQSITATRDGDLFDFLAEEVLDQQTEETRNFLLSTSILQQITPEVAERLTGTHDGRRELRALEHRGLFTYRLDDLRFRYHNLFRAFLERKMQLERSEAEITGLHIHAASYFETTEQWPSAIHHYIRSRLHRQAARLIARFGEDFASEGRLNLIDEWLEQLPDESVKQNARLSLLLGEAAGVRGRWTTAFESLERARTYFARKGDGRLESLACLKLSSVFANYGDPAKAAEVAEAGTRIVPADATATRLRLEGNLAITRTWLAGSLADVAAECIRVAQDASQAGLEHFAAIGYYNAGSVELQMGRFPDALRHLQQAATFWADIPGSPFADNSDLVVTLLATGDVERATSVGEEAVRQTEAWPRPAAHAKYGLAQAYVADGRFAEAVRLLEPIASVGTFLGAVHVHISALLAEAQYLSGDVEAAIGSGRGIAQRHPDPRYFAETAAARALVVHGGGRCKGECLRVAGEFDAAETRGAEGLGIVGRVKTGHLVLYHGKLRMARSFWAAVKRSQELGMGRLVRPWLRLCSPYAEAAIPEHALLLAEIALADPDGWRAALIRCLSVVDGSDREVILRAIAKTANRETVEALAQIPGADVAAVRRELRLVQAPRLFLRTLGGLSLHRGSWDGPVVWIDKRRARALLAVLAAHQSSPLTREMAVDLLWPEADPDAAVNSLNQTVFQLRRFIDPNYRGGESPEYIVSTTEQVGLSSDLVFSDLGELARLPSRIGKTDWEHRQSAAMRCIRLVRGEYLSDLRYEDWVSRQQMAVHASVREQLLPIAQSMGSAYSLDVSAQAATALLSLDPFDEAALICLAECMQRSGRRAAARRVVTDFARRLAEDLDLEPSPDIWATAGSLGLVKDDLTSARPH